MKNQREKMVIPARQEPFAQKDLPLRPHVVLVITVINQAYLNQLDNVNLVTIVMKVLLVLHHTMKMITRNYAHPDIIVQMKTSSPKNFVLLEDLLHPM